MSILVDKITVRFLQHIVEFVTDSCRHFFLALGQQVQNIHFALCVFIDFHADHDSSRSSALSNENRFPCRRDAFHHFTGVLSKIGNEYIFCTIFRGLFTSPYHMIAGCEAFSAVRFFMHLPPSAVCRLFLQVQRRNNPPDRSDRPSYFSLIMLTISSTISLGSLPFPFIA